MQDSTNQRPTEAPHDGLNEERTRNTPRQPSTRESGGTRVEPGANKGWDGSLRITEDIFGNRWAST